MPPINAVNAVSAGMPILILRPSGHMLSVVTQHGHVISITTSYHFVRLVPYFLRNFRRSAVSIPEVLRLVHSNPRFVSPVPGWGVDVHYARQLLSLPVVLYARGILYFTPRDRTQVKSSLHIFSKNLGAISKF